MYKYFIRPSIKDLLNNRVINIQNNSIKILTNTLKNVCHECSIYSLAFKIKS